MEYIEGETLRARLTRPISQAEFRRIGLESASAIAAAHDKGILHRDIKPENIMLTNAGIHPGQVKLLDFGLAQQAADETGLLETATALTMAGMLAGTPQYMAPEILNGEPADRRSDIFALGVVFYEMLNGRHPFAAPTPTAMIGQVLHQPPRPLDPSIPASCAAIVTRALAKSPADRYQTAHEIVRDLQHPDSMPEQAPPAARPVPTRAAPRSRIGRLLALAALAAAIVIVSVTYFLHRRHALPATTASAPVAVTAGTLAVLPPTVADAQDTKLATFGRGLAESLAQRLSDLSVNHDIAVLSARQLEDKKATTLAQAAKEFGATSALALSLTRDGDLVHAAYTVSQPDKAAAQADAPSHVLASGTVTAPVSDMFSIENQLATATATALNIPLRTDEQRALAAHGTTFPEAYQYFLQGRGYLLQAFTAETFKSAQTMFREALRIDPNYGAAKAALGESWLYAYDNNHLAAEIEEAQGLQ